MSARPSISVIVPALRPEYVVQALASIRRQEYAPLEIWMVDNGPSEAIRAVCPAGAHYVVEAARGAANARNRGIRESQSELIAFLDDDDIWTAGHLDRMVAVLEADPGLGIAQGRIRNFRQLADGRLYYCSPPYKFTSLGSAVYRRGVFDTAGLLDATLTFGEDTDFWVRCWEKGIRKTVVDPVSLLYRRHGDNMTTNKNLLELGLVQVLKRRLERKRHGLNVALLPAEGLKDYLGEPQDAWDLGNYQLIEDEI